MAEEKTQITRLLDAASAGQPGATDQLLPLVYDELRKLASGLMSREKAGLTLQPTIYRISDGAVIASGPQVSVTGGLQDYLFGSAVALTVQASAAAMLIPVLGGAGAAIGLAIGEAAVWWPLRHAAPKPATTIDAEPAEPAEVACT